MTVLLSVLTVSTALHAQENQVDAHKKSSCIPVKTVAEKELAYQAGERLHFTLHYEWGAIRSDVATATVSLDSQTLNGQDVFHVKVDGRTTRLYDFFFKIREFNKERLCKLIFKLGSKVVVNKTFLLNNLKTFALSCDSKRGKCGTCSFYDIDNLDITGFCTFVDKCKTKVCFTLL